MAKIKKDTLEYLKKVFKGLSVERKNDILNLARSLQEVQNNKLNLSCAKVSERK